MPKRSLSIDLRPFENLFLKFRRQDPEKFQNTPPGDSFSDRVIVVHREGKQKVKQNLWETANPTGSFVQDGFLSFDEAKGKEFYIPNYFCNTSGYTIFNIRNKLDFRQLKRALARPFGNESRRPFICRNGEKSPEATGTPIKIDSAKEFEATEPFTPLSLEKQERVEELEAATQEFGMFHGLYHLLEVEE